MASKNFLPNHLRLPETFSGKLDWGESDRLIQKYLSENYNESERSWSLKKSAYYALRPLLPRHIQIFLRRIYSRVQSRALFPHWPIEEILVSHMESEMKRLAQVCGQSKIPFVGYWPEGYNWSLVLTHDVESSVGVANIKNVIEIEKTYGFRSSWNFVPERYPFDRNILDWLVGEGFEVGVHGLKHDGKLFSSHQVFQSRLKRIHNYMSNWGAEGFRSPATHRRYEWMPELQFLYDSSFPDTDIYEPQPGGCCWCFPYFIQQLLELPITLPQDHTLLEILGNQDFSNWYKKIEWLRAKNGMALLILHPDYVTDRGRLKLYEQFLIKMSADSSMWNPLPKQLASWWKDRDASRITVSDSQYEIAGPIKDMGGRICFYECT